MAVIASNEKQVAPIFPQAAEIYDFVAGEDVTAGQALYLIASSGRVGAADADATGKQSFLGLALNTAKSGQAVSVLKRGHAAGFTVTQNAWAPVYVSDTTGALDDAPGTQTILAGRVVSLADHAATKVIYIEAEWR